MTISREEVEAVLRKHMQGYEPSVAEATDAFTALLASRPAPALFTDSHGRNPVPRDPAPASAEGWRPNERANLEYLISYWKQDCNRFVNGQCHIAGCLKRGGYNPVEHVPTNYDLATCPARETVLWLERLLAAPASPLGQEWRPIESAPEIIKESRVRFGQHLGKIWTLGDGMLVVVWHRYGDGLPIWWHPLLPPPSALTSALDAGGPEK